MQRDAGDKKGIVSPGGEDTEKSTANANSPTQSQNIAAPTVKAKVEKGKRISKSKRANAFERSTGLSPLG
jgi:hypothetical protein